MSLRPADPFSDLAARAELPSPRVLESIRLEVSSAPAKKRLISRTERVTWSALALLIGLCLSAAAKLEDSPESVLLTGAAFSLSSAGLLLAGAIPTGGRLFGISARRTIFAILSIGLFTGLALRADHFMSFSEFGAGEGSHHAMMCAGHSLIFGVLGASALMFLWRRSDPFSPGLTGAFLGLLGGALGTLGVGLVCTHSEGLHLTLSHGAGVFVVSLLGIFAGRKWLSP
jgi:hypothetical protein